MRLFMPLLIGFILLLTPTINPVETYYQYQGVDSFTVDGANKILSYPYSNSSIVGVNLSNPDLLDVSFSFSTTDKLPYLLEHHGRKLPMSNYESAMRTILPVLGGVFIILSIFNLFADDTYINSFRNKLRKIR